MIKLSKLSVLCVYNPSSIVSKFIDMLAAKYLKLFHYYICGGDLWSMIMTS